MANIYVGPTSAGLADGTSWANRYGSLNAAEDRPIQAGDTVWVGPGVYRETLTCDVSGAAGSPITYIGDYTGSNTDGIGGVVRITGSDNDQTATRANCITATTKAYRTFQSFLMDITTSSTVNLLTSCSNVMINQCIAYGAYNTPLINVTGAGPAVAVSNCMFWVPRSATGVQIFHSSTVSDAGHVISNCIMLAGPNSNGIAISRVGGITVKNSQIWGGGAGVLVAAALAAGQTVTVNNCILHGCNIALGATALGEVTENYNDLYANATARTNVAVGANSLAYPPLFDSRWFFELVNGGRIVSPFDLGAWSQLIDVAGTAPTATDMRGTGAIGGVREWGSLEYDSTLKIVGGSGGAVSISPYRGGIG